MLTDGESDDDWAQEGIPEALARIGLAALPPLEAALADAAMDIYARNALLTAFPLIAQDHPETRERIIATLTCELERPANDAEFCGFILNTLLDMEAVEAAPVIERAFAAGRIDESIAGDWPEVQSDLGLTDTPPPSRSFLGPVSSWSLPPLPGDISRPSRTAQEKAKKRRKEAKKAKKRDRKKR